MFQTVGKIINYQINGFMTTGRNLICMGEAIVPPHALNPPKFQLDHRLEWKK